MFSMFSPDSRFMQTVGKITDLILLNILYLLTCLPVFTIGAATTALYTLCFRMLRQEEGSIVRAYFRAFKENFKQSTILWGILLLILVPDYFYFESVYKMEGAPQLAVLPFVFIAIVTVLAAGFVFPWVSQFRNTIPEILRNALLLCISQLPRAVAIAAINLLPALLWILNYDLFLKISFLWLALYFAAAAFMNAGLLHNVFKPYRE